MEVERSDMDGPKLHQQKVRPRVSDSASPARLPTHQTYSTLLRLQADTKGSVAQLHVISDGLLYQ